MTEAHATTPATPIQARPSKIVRWTSGSTRGPITRLMSASYPDQVLKPFVFLDPLDMEKASFRGIGLGLHAYSGMRR